MAGVAAAMWRPAWLGGTRLSLTHVSSDGYEPPAAARSPAAQQAEQPLDGHSLILAAARQLTYGPSITARLYERVQHADGEVLAVGAYWQESLERGGRFKLELRTKTSHLRIVGEENYIWRQASIAGQHHITRIDLQQYARLTGLDAPAAPAVVGAKSPLDRSAQPLALGGMTHVLSTLAQTYRFSEAQPATLSGVAVLELEGVPAAGTRRPVIPGAGSAGPTAMPSHVTVRLGADDQFPYALLYEWRTAGREDHERGVPTRVEIQFAEVAFGTQIDARHFEYSPPLDAGWEDVTSEVAAGVEPSSEP